MLNLALLVRLIHGFASLFEPGRLIWHMQVFNLDLLDVQRLQRDVDVLQDTFLQL